MKRAAPPSAPAQADHSPVVLPGGSYDFQALGHALEPAVTASPDEREAIVAAAVEQGAHRRDEPAPVAEQDTPPAADAGDAGKES